MLLLVFIHGFKGSAETTFEQFPDRLCHMLSETYPGLHVQHLIYPTYDTRGSLAAAVDNFVEWLTHQCVTLESKPLIDPATGEIRTDSGRGGGMGSVKVILAGHSMGGLVAADAALAIAQNTPPNASTNTRLWPRVCGVIAYDTPYYGVHPGVFKNSLDKYAGYVQTAQTIGTLFGPMGIGMAAHWNANRNGNHNHNNQHQQQRSTNAGNGNGNGWRNALLATGAVALASGAAASAAYFHKDKIGGAYGWVSDHLAFVSHLWDDKALRKRLDQLVLEPRILFHCYYTRLGAGTRTGTGARGERGERTFVILPPRDAASATSFTAMDNDLAGDEVEAHISMFSAKGNARYFDLGLRSANLIALCLENETSHGNQMDAKDKTRDESEEGQQHQGLRFGDAEIEQMRAENNEKARQQQQQQQQHGQGS